MSTNFKDISGQTFGSLKAVSLSKIVPKKSGSVIWWNCICVCGTDVETRGWQLRMGKKTHCGCRPKPFTRPYMGKVKTSHCDRNFLYDYPWYINKGGYLVARINGHMEAFHRLIMEADFDEEIDHINRNKLDNRRSNLRKVPRTINNFNKDILASNKTGFTGVFKIKNRYVAGICKPRINLGSYKNKEDAAYAYQCMKQFIISDY